MSKNLNIIDIDRHIAFYHFHYSTNFNQYPYLDYFKTSLKLSCKNGLDDIAFLTSFTKVQLYNFRFNAIS